MGARCEGMQYTKVRLGDQGFCTVKPVSHLVRGIEPVCVRVGAYVEIQRRTNLQRMLMQPSFIGSINFWNDNKLHVHKHGIVSDHIRGSPSAGTSSSEYVI